MAEIFQNRDQNIEHVEHSIAAHRMPFLDIAALLEHIIAGVQHRSVWPGLTVQLKDKRKWLAVKLIHCSPCHTMRCPTPAMVRSKGAAMP